MRQDASMMVLREIMNHPLDPGYVAGLPRSSRWRDRVFVGVLAVVLGFASAVGARSLNDDRVDAESREVLIATVGSREERGEELASRHRTLVQSIAEFRADAAQAHAQVAQETPWSQRLLAGSQPVQGPGLVVTLVESDEEVVDTDVQRVVNALWAGGAEAISINGHRLTSRTTIRTAGSAILVGTWPLIAPYQVSAVGDAQAMSVSLVRTGTSDQLRILEANYGIRSSVTATSRLTLPAGEDTILFHARPLKDS